MNSVSCVVVEKAIEHDVRERLGIGVSRVQRFRIVVEYIDASSSREGARKESYRIQRAQRRQEEIFVHDCTIAASGLRFAAASMTKHIAPPYQAAMRLVLAALALSLAVVPAEAQRSRAVRPPVRLLWIGAHPDDESLVAPILGAACVEQINDCAILVLTSGAEVRSAEVQRAAAALHARATQWDLPDVFDVSQWGDRAALVTKLASFIVAESPASIYTFDPRHGSSCHPAHREAGQLTLDAVATLGTHAPRVILLETLIVRDAASRITGFAPATPSATAIDATSTWHYLVDDAAIHESQFNAEQIALLQAIPADQRRVWLLPSGAPAQNIASCP